MSGTPPEKPPRSSASRLAGGWVMLESEHAPCKSDCPGALGGCESDLHNIDCPNATLCKKCGSNLSVKFIQRLKYPICCRPPVKSLI